MTNSQLVPAWSEARIEIGDRPERRAVATAQWPRRASPAAAERQSTERGISAAALLASAP